MTVGTKQNPFLLFLKNNIGFMKSYYFGRRNIIFTPHFLTVMMESKRGNWKVFDMTMKTLITKFQNQFSFKRVSSVNNSRSIFYRFYFVTFLTIRINTESISVIFRKFFDWFASFTISTPFVSSTIYYRSHNNSVSHSQTVIKY